MKSLFVVFAGLVLLMSAPARAEQVGNSKLVKTLDGRSVLCVEEVDNGKGGYIPQSLTLSAQDGDLNLSVVLSAVTCRITRSGPSRWDPRGFNDPQPVRAPGRSPAYLKVKDQEAFLVDQNYSVIKRISVGNESTQSFSYTFPIARVLNAEEAARVAAGEVVRKRMEFFLSAIAWVERDGKEIGKGRTAGGAYAILFDVSKNSDGQIQVRLHKVR